MDNLIKFLDDLSIIDPNKVQISLSQKKNCPQLHFKGHFYRLSTINPPFNGRCTNVMLESKSIFKWLIELLRQKLV